MESITKAWDWNKNENDHWLIPTIEASFLAESWKAKNFKTFLDLGCGLGRHTIYFAQRGFQVEAMDLSEYAVEHVTDWAKRENLNIHAQAGNMLELPYHENSIDCIIAYNVIHHTDTLGFIRTLEEIKRVLKPGGEMFVTLVSKNTWSFQKADSGKRLDGNTILRDEFDTKQTDVPHFYLDIHDIKKHFKYFDFIKVLEQTEYNLEKPEFYSKHFVLLIRKK